MGRSMSICSTDYDVMLLSISQDFADWPPGTSASSPDLTAEVRARFDALLARGRERAMEDCTAALPIFEQTLEIDSGFAALHFELADCARELGPPERAYSPTGRGPMDINGTHD